MAWGDRFECVYGQAFLKNKDLDSEGKYETVIGYFYNNGDCQQLEMIMNKQGFPQVVLPSR